MAKDNCKKWKKNYALTEKKLDLAPGVNFINILRTTFTFVDPKSLKKYS